MTAPTAGPSSLQQPSIVPKLEEKIEALRGEKLLADAERRRIAVRAKNEKARRMVRRLESCDGNIADLLAQASESLQTLVDATAHESSFAAHADVRSYDEAEDELRRTFEIRAQQWFATLHEVQLGLRSAVRNLRKAQREPTQRDISAVAAGASANSSASSSTSGVSPALNHVGKAERGHGLGLHSSETALSSSAPTSSTPRGSLLDAFVNVGSEGPDLVANRDKEPIRVSFGHDSKLSLPTLRMHEQSWSQLAEALNEIAERQKAASARSSASKKASQRSSSLPGKPGKGNGAQQERLRSLAIDLTAATDSQDARLMSALLQMNIGLERDIGSFKTDSMGSDQNASGLA